MPIYIGYVATSIRCQGRSLKCKIATLTSVVALAVTFMNPVIHTELTWQHLRYIIQETLAHDLNITGIRVILTIPFANQHESRRLLISNFPWSGISRSKHVYAISADDLALESPRHQQACNWLLQFSTRWLRTKRVKCGKVFEVGFLHNPSAICN